MKALYRFCNGFESAEDIFRIIPLKEIVEELSRYGPNSFAFADVSNGSIMQQVSVEKCST